MKFEQVTLKIVEDIADLVKNKINLTSFFHSGKTAIISKMAVRIFLRSLHEMISLTRATTPGKFFHLSQIEAEI